MFVRPPYVHYSKRVSGLIRLQAGYPFSVPKECDRRFFFVLIFSIVARLLLDCVCLSEFFARFSNPPHSAFCPIYFKVLFPAVRHTVIHDRPLYALLTYFGQSQCNVWPCSITACPTFTQVSKFECVLDTSFRPGKLDQSSHTISRWPWEIRAFTIKSNTRYGYIFEFLYS